ncbi:hypothetical protein FVEN_g9564 [Fusarium venenatum]|nr:hypothetical protein FVEN_g9564 [Fusarium venenatum]
MKLRRKNVCQTCREHKIGCDGNRPSCSQCRHTGRVCTGYPPDFEFISTNGQGRQRANDTGTRANDSLMANRASNQENCLTRTIAPAIQDAANLIIRSYVPENEIPWLNQIQDTQPRICGGWVATLPELLVVSGSDELLPAAVKTLALAIASKRSQLRVISPTLWQSYGSTVKLLQQSLSRCGGSCNNEHLAAMMCLTLTELVGGSNKKGDWMVHIDGISTIIQHLGPEFFARGIPHKLFIGFRPLLVLKAIISRTPSFLTNERWIIGPFQDIPASPMQQLLTEAVAIPSVLKRIDLLHTYPAAMANSGGKVLQDALRTILQRLCSWEDRYESKFTGPLYWPHAVGISRPEDICLWFNDVTVANALTHYWAFTAICLVYIQKLELANKTHVLNDAVRQQYVRPLTLICRSIPFLLQESLNLYGSSSVAFLISTVLEIFKWNEQHGGTEIILHRHAVDYAKSQGFYFASSGGLDLGCEG